MPNVKIVRDTNKKINIKKTTKAILENYQNNNKLELDDYLFTIERLSKADYSIIRSNILDNYNLLFSIEPDCFNNISVPKMKAHIYTF